MDKPRLAYWIVKDTCPVIPSSQPTASRPPAAEVPHLPAGDRSCSREPRGHKRATQLICTLKSNNRWLLKCPGWLLSGLEHRPIHQKVAGSIPCHDIYLGCASIPSPGMFGSQSIDISLSNMSLSLSLSLSLHTHTHTHTHTNKHIPG